MKKVSLQQILKKIPPRIKNSHKKTYGHAFVLAGSPGMTGAAALASQAAIRSGCGYVTLGVPESLNPIMEAKLTEVMTLPLPETECSGLSVEALLKIMSFSSDATSLAIGPGLSAAPETLSLVRMIVQRADKPIVVDADAISAFAEHKEMLNNKPLVITPHPGEFCKLTLIDKKKILASPDKVAAKFAKEHGIVVVLKGHRAVVTDGKNIYINASGNPGMSTAGAGDVLTGMITSFLAQGALPFEAAAMGVYFHGRAGDQCAKRIGMMGMIAGDIVKMIPGVLKEYERISSSKIRN